MKSTNCTWTSRGLLLDSVSYEEALAESDDIAKRYFVNKELTDSVGTGFYVSNQWGIHNIDEFILKARAMRVLPEIF